MITLEKNYNHDIWKVGTRQELIPEQGETVDDAAEFMTKHLDYFKIKNLTFKKEDIEEIDGKFYVTLIGTGYDKPARGERFL